MCTHRKYCQYFAFRCVLYYVYMLLLQHSCSPLNKEQKVWGPGLSVRCHKFWAFTGSLLKMEHEKVLSGGLRRPLCSFLSFNLCKELGSTYCRPDLGNHNAKYKIMISLQGLYKRYWYSSDTCTASPWENWCLCWKGLIKWFLLVVTGSKYAQRPQLHPLCGKFSKAHVVLVQQRLQQSISVEYPLKLHVHLNCWSLTNNKKLYWIHISRYSLKKLFTAELIIFIFPTLNPHLSNPPKENEGMHASKHLCCALFNSASRF